METQGRYAAQVRAGMWLKAWSGWRQVEHSPTVDQIGWITFRFTDGSATAIHHAEVVVTRDA